MMKIYEKMIKRAKIPIIFKINEKTIKKAKKLGRVYSRKENIESKKITSKFKFPIKNMSKKMDYLSEVIQYKDKNIFESKKSIKLKKMVVTHKIGRKTKVSTIFIETDEKEKRHLTPKHAFFKLNYWEQSKKINEQIEREVKNIKKFSETYIQIRVQFLFQKKKLNSIKLN